MMMPVLAVSNRTVTSLPLLLSHVITGGGAACTVQLRVSEFSSVIGLFPLTSTDDGATEEKDSCHKLSCQTQPAKTCHFLAGYIGFINFLTFAITKTTHMHKRLALHSTVSIADASLVILLVCTRQV